MEPAHVLGNATICNFPIPEIPLDYEKGVLYLTANRRDTIFHLLFPVDSLIVFGCFQAGGTLTNAVIDLEQVFILYDILLFRNTQVSWVSVHDMVILPDQFSGFCRVMDIGSRALI